MFIDKSFNFSFSTNLFEFESCELPGLVGTSKMYCYNYDISSRIERLYCWLIDDRYVISVFYCGVKAVQVSCMYLLMTLIYVRVISESCLSLSINACLRLVVLIVC